MEHPRFITHLVLSTEVLRNTQEHGTPVTSLKNVAVLSFFPSLEWEHFVRYVTSIRIESNPSWPPWKPALFFYHENKNDTKLAPRVGSSKGFLTV